MCNEKIITILLEKFNQETNTNIENDVSCVELIKKMQEIDNKKALTIYQNIPEVKEILNIFKYYKIFLNGVSDKDKNDQDNIKNKNQNLNNQTQQKVKDNKKNPIKFKVLEDDGRVYIQVGQDIYLNIISVFDDCSNLIIDNPYTIIDGKCYIIGKVDSKDVIDYLIASENEEILEKIFEDLV